jgi:hypothetical protein
MIIRNNNSFIDNLSDKIDKKIKEKIDQGINSNGTVDCRGAEVIRDGLLRFSALPMKNIKKNNYATFPGDGTTVGP